MNSRRQKSGFTLVEILIATVLTLVIMGTLVTVFDQLGSSIAANRSGLEMNDRRPGLQQKVAGHRLRRFDDIGPQQSVGGHAAKLEDALTELDAPADGILDDTLGDIGARAAAHENRPLAGQLSQGTAHGMAVHAETL